MTYFDKSFSLFPFFPFFQKVSYEELFLQPLFKKGKKRKKGKKEKEY
jgi:hypothetical protein